MVSTGGRVTVSDIKIGITGLPGSGKTYALLRIIEMLREDGLVLGGMINEPIEEDRSLVSDETGKVRRVAVKGKRKIGFTVMDLQTGEKTQFAGLDVESKVTVGRIGVDLSKFEEVGVAAIRNACRKAGEGTEPDFEECDIIVIDEVGKVEVESEKFVEAVREALDADKPMILTLHKKSRNPLLQDIRRRDDVRILEVTPTNRNILPYKVIRLMNGENL
ncbi:MAG: NTPase [Candidatus Methanomethylophilaceae archaeon]|nr:NTPase [Candidatus Methanomethylophilaceae archaeon]